MKSDTRDDLSEHRTKSITVASILAAIAFSLYNLNFIWSIIKLTLYWILIDIVISLELSWKLIQLAIVSIGSGYITGTIYHHIVRFVYYKNKEV
ncbi:MAG: hypothetical protein KatS3mg022_3578 [Armatimonadota bacterium]|nr:MAG: hypothetical protein KatS3mg022_3578 [Armatimonadota bacterium]